MVGLTINSVLILVLAIALVSSRDRDVKECMDKASGRPGNWEWELRKMKCIYHICKQKSQPSQRVRGKGGQIPFTFSACFIKYTAKWTKYQARRIRN
ncbi:hypothetical protein ScPMuIL_005687 [Solemya velum]